MRKKTSIVFVLLLLFFTTGCVKFNANMDIKKDKSMNFEIIYAVDTKYFGETELLEVKEKDNLEKAGFVIKDYIKDTMKGITISKKIKNIDIVSKNEETKFSLSNILEQTIPNTPLFKVKKGIFKNVYTANFTFDSSDSSLNEDVNIENNEEENIIDETENNDKVENEENLIEEEINKETENEISNIQDLTTAIGNMDLSFNVTLPYAAISNNASEVSNNNKQLKWKLTTDEVSSMQFQFELYNIQTICILSVTITILILVIILVLINKKKKTKLKTETNHHNINQVSENHDIFNKQNVQSIDQTIQNGFQEQNNINNIQNTNMINSTTTNNDIINNQKQ